jgi:transcription elongation factor Elf1
MGVIVTSDGDWTGWQSHTEADAAKARGCTEETLQRYVKHPYFCPFCEHPVVEATKLEAFENMVYQWVRCDKCETEWQDVFELVGVERVEIP